MTCFGGSEARLYLIELTIERLRLSEATFKANFKSGVAPVVKIELLDLPQLAVVRRPSRLRRGERPDDGYDEIQGVVYNSGKSALLTRKPRDLVDNMRAKPMRLEIYRPCDIYPVAVGSVPLAGCLCNQIAMVDNDADHMPRPYELNACYDLAAPGGDYAGNIKIYFRLTMLGTHVITHYDLLENTCLCKTEKGEEWRVTRAEARSDEGQVGAKQAEQDEEDEEEKEKEEGKEAEDGDEMQIKKRFKTPRDTALAAMVGDRPKT